MQLFRFHGGVHPAENKAMSAEAPIVKARIPKYLVLPLLQHIGTPTEPVVKSGDKVLKGQVIARCQSNDCSLHTSTPVHASTSGTVIAIEPRHVPHPSGLMATCIIIETDGRDTWLERPPIDNYTALSPDIVRQHIAQAGIVGLGGAGFPSHLKLKPDGIDTLILNGAECEPYITCDDALMRQKPQDIIAGAEILMYVLGGAKHCIIAVEDNKPEAYEALVKGLEHFYPAFLADHYGNEADYPKHKIEVVKVPTLYPTGGEKQLIYILTGKEIGRSRLPAEEGIVVHNVETARAIYRAVEHGQPLLCRLVTITGSGIEKPQNLEVLLGTPMHEVIDWCGRKPDIERLISGGSMMGFSLPNDELPIVKTTNCLIASQKEDVDKLPPAMPCIRCGQCAEACPIHLLPQQLYWYAKAKDFKNIQRYNLFDCIECGCCSYVCPSHIPLVNYYRYAKSEIRAQEREKRHSDIAKQRHEFRSFRIEREKAEKAAKHKARAKAVAKTKDKKAEIDAAVARAKQKQTADTSDKNS